MLNKTITLKYSRVENGLPIGVRREVPLAEVLAALEQMSSQPNDYTMWSDGERIMDFFRGHERVIANGEAKEGGGLYYRREITSAHYFEEFVQQLRITQLLPDPDGSGLKSHFPISPEVWLP